MIMSLVSIWQRTRADMTSHRTKVAQTYRDRHTWPSNARVGHQRVQPSRSKLQGLRWYTAWHFPIGTDTGAKKDTCRSIHVFRSSSELPWLSGSTRRHFPVGKATKGARLGVEPHTYRCISKHTHNMHDMCRYNMASQHNSTTQVLYLRGSKEPYITYPYR